MPDRYVRLVVGACALIFTAAITVHAGGTGSEVWGVDSDEFSFRLRSGEYEFLKSVDLSSEASDRSLREVARLGDEAFHMLGLIYADLDLPLYAERLFAASWRGGSEPWRHKSILELLRLLEAGERYPELESLARAGLERYEDEPDILKRLISALYRQEKDAEVIALSAVLDGQMGNSNSADPWGAEDSLRRAVSSSRLDLPGWEDRYRELFGDFAAGHEHSRVWVFLMANPEIASRFSHSELQFFEAKQLLAEGRSMDAANRFGDVADAVTDRSSGGGQDEARALLLSPSGLRDFYLAGSLSGHQSATATRLIAIADDDILSGSPGEVTTRALEYAGRLYRTAGNYWLAVGALERCLLLQSPGPDAERVRWYLLNSRVRLDPVEASRSLAAVTPTLGDPAYYSDLFAELAMRLAGLERWDALLQAYQAIRDFGTAGTRAAYELVLAEAIGDGKLQTNTEPGSLREAHLERAAEQTEDLFAALLASALLGETGEDVLRAAAAAVIPARARADEAGLDLAARIEELLAAYLQYGLLDRAYTTARGNPELIRRNLLIQLADQLTAGGRIREAIQVALRIPAATDGLPAHDVLRRQYPRGFAQAFDEVLAEEPVDRWVLYALVREESLFDPEIVSGAGAIGLTQLLRETADDVARRMRIDPPDLNDPVDNLRVGARYLAMLEDQFGGLLKALAAYNAGQGRVRSWERQRPGLSGVLFHQSIPYEETFNHIRNIVVSAVYYGYLYEGRTPTDTIHIVFREHSD